MTERKEALIALLEKVEAGMDTTWNDFESCFEDAHVDDAAGAERGSLDAAKALHDAVLPGWSAEARMSGFGGGQAAVWNPMKRPGLDIRVDADNPARALLIAILKALIAKEDA